jgi:Holliday junction resolvasome RuvABC ATP-dependent DNA helicase subunit
MQSHFVFFGPKDSKARPEPTDAEKRAKIDRNNSAAPFSRFIGNDRAVKKLQVAAYKALGHPYHMMRDLSFAIYGPASAGKTTLARLYAETVQLPFLEVSPKSLKTVDDLFDQISVVLKDAGIPLVECKTNHYKLPPMVIFIDEVHALVDSVVQGLLKATEYNDAILVTESGKVLDCYAATWMIATTDEGKLFDAFRTRFSPVQLKYLTKAELSKIVHKAHPDLTSEVCGIVAHYNSRVPRKALEFARYMKLVREMDNSLDWREVAQQVAEDEGIDKFGMSEVHFKVLKSLATGPVAQSRMTTVVGRKIDEVEKFIMPWLLTETDDQPALVGVSRRGYVLTDAGREQLSLRGIAIAA